jgi:3-dehydroquinate synthase
MTSSDTEVSGYHCQVDRIRASSSRGGYSVIVGTDLLGRLGEVVDNELGVRPRAVVSNVTVAPLYGQRAAQALGTPPCLELEDGEVHKRWPTVETLCGSWLEQGLHRADSVLAIGGGVVTDTVGFAAAVYMRGISWVAVPTTLLAMVDAAIGGKTGVNLEGGKNLVGALWHPQLVVADVSTLSTLPERELAAGLAEVIKTAWIGDRSILRLLDRPVAAYCDCAPATWHELIVRSIQVKVRVVETDERESGPRKALNLGHTLGHALEAATEYRRLLHGEAVAWGLMAVESLARRRGLLTADSGALLQAALARLGPLPSIADLSWWRVLEAIVRDKKRDDLGVAWVLPTDEGVALDQRVSAAELQQVFAELQQT